MSAEEYREPPDLRGKELDFSQFHPFDHPWWSRACRQYYGGPRRHLQMKWQFIWSSEMRRLTLCRVGRHHPVQVTRMKDGKPDSVFLACRNCGKRMSRDQPV